MATNFPTSLDTSTTIPAEGASTALSTNHVTAHQNIQDAIEAIEAKVGADSSAVTSSHDYKLSEVTSTDKAVGKTASQALSNKTLTSPKITVGSDAVGDLHYTSNADGTQSRIAIGTDNQILKINGSTIGWEAETTITAATESVEGISRLATAAQITAGTASEASYPLVVTPDQLALSTPVFNGSGLTNVSQFTGTVFCDAPVGTISFSANAFTSNTTLTLALYHIPHKITINKVSVNATAVTVAGTFDISMYSHDGQTQYFSVTTASISGTGVVTTSVSSVTVNPGYYWIATNPNGTMDVTLSTVAVSTLYDVSGETPIMGSYTITAGTPPATITLASIVASSSSGVQIRLDN